MLLYRDCDVNFQKKKNYFYLWLGVDGMGFLKYVLILNMFVFDFIQFDNGVLLIIVNGFVLFFGLVFLGLLKITLVG